MAYTKLNFGKHRGATLPQVLFRDPDWFYYMVESGILDSRGWKDELDLLCPRSRRIQIPGNPDAGLEMQVFIHPHTGGVYGAELVPADQESHARAYRSGYLDLAIPYLNKRYDKQGNRSLIAFLKFIHFGDSGYRMTLKRCEEFYDNPHIFDHQ